MPPKTPYQASTTVHQVNHQKRRDLLRHFLACPHPLCPWELGSDTHTRRQHISSAHGGVQLLACGDILGRSDAHGLDFHVDACDYCKRDEEWPEMSTLAYLNDLLHDEAHRELRRRGVEDVFLEISRQRHLDDAANDEKSEEIKHTESGVEAPNADKVP